MSLFKSNSKEPSQGKLSAEERLLEVIQNGGEATAQTSGPPRQGFYQKVLSTFKKSDSASTQTAVRGFDLARLNGILSLIIVLGMGLSIINIYYFKPDIKKIYTRVVAAPPSQTQMDLSPISVDDFLATLTGRNIFQPKVNEPPPVPVETTPPPTDTPVIPSGEVGDLQLVGIAWGSQPEVMIRDKKGGRTFFLKEGEELKGVKAKEILKDKVIVEHQGETKELM